MTLKHLIIFSLLLLSTNTFAQTSPKNEKENFWEHLYMPLEMGISFSTHPNQNPAYAVNTSLEYRFGRVKGWYLDAEYDEHTHSYADKDLKTTNIIKGDIQYTDWLIGPGWRQPLFKKISATAMLQAGATITTLKDVRYVESNDRYHLADNKKVVPSAKLSLGMEYVFDPSFNLFIHASLTQHLQKTQLESDATRGVITISAGFNVNLF